MNFPIELKSEEFLVLVTIETNPKFERPLIDILLEPLPESFQPIFVAYEKTIIKIYCLCTSKEDFVYNLAKTGYKTVLL